MKSTLTYELRVTFALPLLLLLLLLLLLPLEEEFDWREDTSDEEDSFLERISFS